MHRLKVGRIWRMVLALAMVVMSLASVPVAMAATTVTIADGDVTGFINAITSGNASGTPTIINLSSGGNYVLTTQFYDPLNVYNYSGLPEITGNFTIHGNDSVIRRDPTAAVFGILDVASGGTLNIDHVTITGGNNDNPWYKNGGGIYNAGALTVTHSTITGNTAPNGGGGIYNFHGSLTVVSSTISNNTSPDCYLCSPAGGGINNSDGTATISNSTIAGNSAGWGGGGIHNVGGTTTVVNSTVVDNSTVYFGGGIQGYSSGSVTVTNSIVANNTSTNVPSGANIYGASPLVVDNGHNEIGSDAFLGTLADNGGPTQTIALQPGSPAIDTGDDIVCSAAPVNGVDQRGYFRPAGSHCDIGAFEYGAVGPVAPAFTFDLSTLPAKTSVDPSFSVASYATKPADDAGLITFALGNGSDGCSVTSDGTVTITGSGQCIIEASLAASDIYTSAGPISQSFSITPATMCAPGSYSTTGFEPCTPADAGNFVAGSGAMSETACLIGYYQPLTGQTSCLPAPAGSFVDQSGAIAATLCPAGTYQPLTGQTSCLLAPVNTYVDTSGATAPTPCPAGTYQPLEGQTSCIAQTTPVITWSNPTDITYGTALSSTQLNATANVAGTFTYTPAIGTVLNAGNGQTLTVDFAPNDATSYTSASKSVSINVAQASQTITFTSTAPSGAVFGNTYSPAANGGASGNPVTFGASGACTYASGVVTMSGTGTCVVTANQAGNTNYAAAVQVTQTFSVAQASATITLDSSTLNQTYDGGQHVVTASTNPSGLSYSVTYNGNASAPADAGSYAVVATITDPNYSGSDSGTLVVAQVSQTITFGSLTDKVVGDPAFAVSATGGASGNPVTFTAGPAGVCSASGINGSTISIDGAGSCTVTASQAGNQNYSAAADVSQSFSITNPISNVAPMVTITSPAIGTVVPTPYNATLTAPFADTGDTGPHTCTISWGDGGSTMLAVNATDPSVCTATHAYADAGVYTVAVTITDEADLSGNASVMLVVYDPSAGFVTGGGWIDSPAGAYTADPTMTGKATFGFVSKYKKGATVPTGTTQFQFDAAGFSFTSDSYQWLVVNQSGTNAQFKGTGTINGTGSYTFMIWAGDGNPDTFRIQITDNNNNNTIVYDNGTDQAIGGGAIIVHTGKN